MMIDLDETPDATPIEVILHNARWLGVELGGTLGITAERAEQGAYGSIPEPVVQALRGAADALTTLYLATLDARLDTPS